LEAVGRNVVVRGIRRDLIGRTMTGRAITGRMLKKSIGLKQAHAQNERERNLAAGRIENAGTRGQAPNGLLELAQAYAVDEVAPVEQDDVAIHELIAQRRAFEAIEREVLGIHDGHDGIEANEIAELRAQEGQRDR